MHDATNTRLTACMYAAVPYHTRISAHIATHMGYLFIINFVNDRVIQKAALQISEYS